MTPNTYHPHLQAASNRIGALGGLSGDNKTYKAYSPYLQSRSTAHAETKTRGSSMHVRPKGATGQLAAKKTVTGTAMNLSSTKNGQTQSANFAASIARLTGGHDASEMTRDATTNNGSTKTSFKESIRENGEWNKITGGGGGGGSGGSKIQQVANTLGNAGTKAWNAITGGGSSPSFGGTTGAKSGSPFSAVVETLTAPSKILPSVSVPTKNSSTVSITALGPTVLPTRPTVKGTTITIGGVPHGPTLAAIGKTLTNGLKTIGVPTNPGKTFGSMHLPRIGGNPDLSPSHLVMASDIPTLTYLFGNNIPFFSQIYTGSGDPPQTGVKFPPMHFQSNTPGSNSSGQQQQSATDQQSESTCDTSSGTVNIQAGKKPTGNEVQADDDGTVADDVAGAYLTENPPSACGPVAGNTSGGTTSAQAGQIPTGDEVQPDEGAEVADDVAGAYLVDPKPSSAGNGAATPFSQFQSRDRFDNPFSSGSGNGELKKITGGGGKGATLEAVVSGGLSVLLPNQASTVVNDGREIGKTIGHSITRGWNGGPSFGGATGTKSGISYSTVVQTLTAPGSILPGVSMSTKGSTVTITSEGPKVLPTRPTVKGTTITIGGVPHGPALSAIGKTLTNGLKTIGVPTNPSKPFNGVHVPKISVSPDLNPAHVAAVIDGGGSGMEIKFPTFAQIFDGWSLPHGGGGGDGGCVGSTTAGSYLADGPPSACGPVDGQTQSSEATCDSSGSQAADPTRSPSPSPTPTPTSTPSTTLTPQRTYPGDPPAQMPSNVTGAFLAEGPPSACGPVDGNGSSGDGSGSSGNGTPVQDEPATPPAEMSLVGSSDNASPRSFPPGTVIEFPSGVTIITATAGQTLGNTTASSAQSVSSGTGQLSTPSTAAVQSSSGVAQSNTPGNIGSQFGSGGGQGGSGQGGGGGGQLGGGGGPVPQTIVVGAGGGSMQRIVGGGPRSRIRVGSPAVLDVPTSESLGVPAGSIADANALIPQPAAGGQGNVPLGDSHGIVLGLQADGQNQGGQPSDANSDASDAAAPTVQFTRYLRLGNATKENVTFYVEYYTCDDQGKWSWTPGKPGAEDTQPMTFELAAGEAADIQDGDWQINAVKVRVWARSESGKQWTNFKDKDLLLVPEVDDAGQHSYLSNALQTVNFSVR